MENFSLAGFKAINKQKDFVLAPITLLVGPNGSGKSTVIKGLNMIKDLFYEERNDNNGSRPETAIQYKAHVAKKILETSGITNSILNQNLNRSSFSIECPFPLAYFPDEFSLHLTYCLSDRAFELSEIGILNKTLGKPLVEISTSSDARLLSHSTVKVDYRYLFDFLEDRLTNLPKEKRNIFDGARNPTDEEMQALGKELYEQAQEPLLDFDKIGHCDLKRENRRRVFDYHLENLLRAAQLKDYFKLEGIAINEAPDLVNALKDALVDLYMAGKNIEHSTTYSTADIFEFFLSRGRTSLTDNDAIPADLKNLSFTDGDKLSFVGKILLRENIEHGLTSVQQSLRDVIYIPPNRFRSYDSNDPSLPFGKLSEDLRQKLKGLKVGEWWDEPVQHFIDYWLEEFGISSKVGRQTLLKTLQSLENGFADIELGYGLNQLLPLIYHSAIFNAQGDPITNNGNADYFDRSMLRSLPGYTFLIEEPEANLHPNFQSKLADLFIDAAWRFNHNFVIETHSEYMVRKFQYWVAKGKIKPDSVKIYYFDNKNNDKEVKDVEVTEITILPSGDLSRPFGEGFYDEAINLQYELLKIKKTQEN